MSSEVKTPVTVSGRDMARYASELPKRTREKAFFSLCDTNSMRSPMVLVDIYCMSHGLVSNGSTTTFHNRALKLTSIITDYLAHSGKQLADVPSSSLAYLVNLDAIATVSPVVARGILQELISQRSNLKLIASENFSSIPTQLAMANLLTDKYAEGFPHSRFYAGCENVDLIEETACNLAKNLFGADHAY